jgi:hypothetical protein
MLCGYLSLGLQAAPISPPVSAYGFTHALSAGPGKRYKNMNEYLFNGRQRAIAWV